MTAKPTVLFDAGLTLIYNHTSTTDMAHGVLRRRSIDFAPERLEACMARAEAELSATWHRGDFWGSENSVRALFRDAYALGLADLPALNSDAELARSIAVEMYEGFADVRHWSLYEDVVAALDTLHRAEVMMGVISDWGHGLEALLLELGLGPYFDCLVVSSRLGISKPSAAVFEMALDRIGARPVDAFYVGDTYVKDVMGARAAGIHPILLDRQGRFQGAEIASDCPIISDLRELPALVLKREA